MVVSMIELYEKTGVNPEIATLMPVTSNLEGFYSAEGVVNMGLMMLLAGYYRAEKDGTLNKIKEDSNAPEDERWAKVSQAYVFMDADKEEDREYIEYGLHQGNIKGYVEVEFWEGFRYYKPTEKCMNLELYTSRNSM